MRDYQWYHDKKLREIDVVHVANSLLTKKVSFLKGIRLLTELRLALGEEKFSHLFTLFEDIDELTFHIPPVSDDNKKNTYSSLWLTKTEQEMKILEKKYRVRADKNCRELIAYFK